ncbi:beta clamp domain-containing protein [Merdimmobilis hominis]|uniref:hypothetical protein n=1 Tax=Merdimmobilis hominis TaxID=2897707 RepID=UPI0008F903AE|nr:hypothetical protein [Merdimmobilis hominis]
MSTPKLFEMDFDKAFSAEVKRLGNLATQGSYAMLRGEAPDRLIVCFYGKEVQSRSCFEYPVQNEFTVFANAKDILDLLKSFPEGKLSVRDSMLTLSAGKTRMNRALPPSIPEPVFPEFPAEGLSGLPQNVFENAALAAYAAAQSAHEDSTERVSILLTHDRVSITATNGQIAACVESPADYTGDGTEEYLLHPRVITALAPLSIKEDAPEILIGSDGRRYLLRFGEYEITVSIPSCASRRSSIDAVIKALSPTPCLDAVIDASSLTLFLERAKLLDSSARKQPVFLSADSSKGCVEAHYETGLGNIEDVLPAQTGGSLPKAVVAISPRNLSEVCSHLQLPVMQMKIYGPSSPLVVTELAGKSKITHIALPIVVKQGASEDDLPFNVNDWDE